MGAIPFKKFRNKAVIIMGYPKSGTTLLLSLLDYHRQLLVFPFELKYFQRIIGPGYYRDMSRQEKIKILFEKIGLRRLKNGKIEYGERVAYGNHDFSDIDYGFFRQRVLDRMNQAFSDKEMMLSVIESFYDVENSDKDDKRAWVEKTPYNNYYFPLLKEWFGEDLICLHVVRDPYDNFASYRKKLFKSLTIERFCSDWVFSNALVALAEKIIKNYHVIQYEDLVSSPQKIMRQVCEWIGVNYDESLLVPTLNGKPWFGNSSHGHKFKQISTKSVGCAERLLAPAERARIGRLIGRKDLLFNFQTSKRLFIFRARWRFPKAYKYLIRGSRRIKDIFR